VIFTRARCLRCAGNIFREDLPGAIDYACLACGWRESLVGRVFSRERPSGRLARRVA
jgi:DNA-directed RNA polymerase subunit RPC12/RpoP